MDSVAFLGVPVHALTLEGAVKRCLQIIDGAEGRTSTLVHVNPHSLVAAHSDPVVHKALATSDLRLPDGAGLVLVSRLRGCRLPGRVAGPDLLPALTDALAARGGARYFFYGSTDDVLMRIRERMSRSWPAVEVVGTLSPPFRSLDEAEEAAHVEIINAASPDVLWVGMTAPKQECWVLRNRDRLRVPLAASVGAAFDYLAGTKDRSPRWFRDHGLEWMARLAMEPGRLWRRTLLSAPLFLWYSLRESLGRRPGAAH